MNTINKDLNEYLETKILLEYDSNIGGHGKDHILYVWNRCLEIIKEYNIDVDLSMLKTIAFFHDIGYKEDPDNHEEVSARKLLEDKYIKKFFGEQDLKIMSEAVVDHRASLEYEARNIYGKIVSSADREISVENMLLRSFLFQKDKHKDENPTVNKIIEYSFKKLSSKYGKGGYAKMYYPDSKYRNYINEMQFLLENKDKFIDAEMQIAKSLNK